MVDVVADISAEHIPSMGDINDITALLSADSNGNISCPQCPKSFTSNKLLQQHQTMFHSDKSFVCEICGKAFRFRSNLAEHRSVHTAVKPYVCKYCGKSSRLKGNLTKHILKHHKKEQNEQILKDDIIIRKDEVADRSSLVINDLPLSLLPKEETTEQDRSILISLGIDYNNSIDLRESPDHSASPMEGSPTSTKNDPYEGDTSYGSPLPSNTVGGETSLAALIASVNSPPPTTPASVASSSLSINTPSHSTSLSKTKCELCGKHFRKREQMMMHMTINHGFPPPESTASSDGGKMSEAEPQDDWLHRELLQMRQMISDLKATPAPPQQNPRIEQLFSGLDSRIGRLEKQVEMALNSIYTLVQLQTGMNSSVTRFKEEACEQLRGVRAMLKEKENSGEDKNNAS